MRFEQIIAAVARTVAIVEVRTIAVADAFANAMRLHDWLRMFLGLSSDSGLPSCPGLLLDSKRGAACPQLIWVTATCPAGTATA